MDSPDIIKKIQRKTTNLGINRTSIRDSCYDTIEKEMKTSKCFDSNHEGDRDLPIRHFYLNKNGKSLQGACITCQKIRRANRIKRCREKYQNKTKEEIYQIYKNEYGNIKICSKCKESKIPEEFNIAKTIESGLHNLCFKCSILSTTDRTIRNYIYMPDKDGINYSKEKVCVKCGDDKKLSVDHIIPISKGGNDCITNKQTLCIKCNSSKHNRIQNIIKPEYLCERYIYDIDMNDITNASKILENRVNTFKEQNIINASPEDIKILLKQYACKYNLGDNLDRIFNKISRIFNKC